MSAIVHIHKLFSEAVSANYNTKRYGVKSCSTTIDAAMADDLRNIYIRALEIELCESCNTGCTVSVLEEKINTL